MQKRRLPTSRFGFGSMIHAIHMGSDVPALNAFYEDVFGGMLYMGVDEPSYMPAEKRHASLLMISDLCVETMAPDLPPDLGTPVGRFYDRFGDHWHSIGFTVEDFEGLGRHLQANDVYLGKPGGGPMEDFEAFSYFYPHPRHVGGVMVECCSVEMPRDPRLEDSWSSLAKLWANHPLGAERTGWVTIGVEDIDSHLELWQRLFEVVPVYDELSPLGHRSQFVHFGDLLVELAQPLDPGSDLDDHVKRFDDMMFEVTLKVVDLERAEAHLNSKGVRTVRADSEMLLANSEDTFGARWAFTTRKIPNDPFDA